MSFLFPRRPIIRQGWQFDLHWRIVWRFWSWRLAESKKSTHMGGNWNHATKWSQAGGGFHPHQAPEEQDSRPWLKALKRLEECGSTSWLVDDESVAWDIGWCSFLPPSAGEFLRLQNRASYHGIQWSKAVWFWLEHGVPGLHFDALPKKDSKRVYNTVHPTIMLYIRCACHDSPDEFWAEFLTISNLMCF